MRIYIDASELPSELECPDDWTPATIRRAIEDIIKERIMCHYYKDEYEDCEGTPFEIF